MLSYENLQDPNSLHRLTGVQDVTKATGANIAGFGYGYDSPGTQNGFLDNRTSQTRAYGIEAAQTISYGYNATSMLQGEGANQGGASTPALSNSYQFDAMGNRTGFSDAVTNTQITSTYNNLNQLTSTNSFSTSSGQAVATGSSSFGYDGNGNMSLITSKDATGTTTGQTSYSYDDASRLTGITTPGSSKWQFVYDGASRLRISRSWVWQNGAWVQNSEKRRVYLGMDVVQERDANNSVIASYSGGLSARSTSTGTVFYGFDGSGSVSTLTDSAGAVVGSYTYDAWGNILASSGLKANENPYRYSGEEQIAGIYEYGFRFYSPGMGRWINRDPIAEDGGGNLYGMVGNDPVNAVDAYGLDALYLVGRNKANPSYFSSKALSYAKNYVSRTHMRATIVEVRSFADIQYALKTVKNIDILQYVGHGHPGVLYVGNSKDDIYSSQISNLFTGNVSKNADIDIIACQSSVDPKGGHSIAFAFSKQFHTMVVGYSSDVGFGYSFPPHLPRLGSQKPWFTLSPEKPVGHSTAFWADPRDFPMGLH